MGTILSCDQHNPSEVVLSQAADVLSHQGVVVFPTDSVYGIGAAALPNCEGLARIFTIKSRPRSFTLPWLVESSRALLRYGRMLPSWAHDLAKEFWPGALTLVVRASGEVSPEYRAADGTIALRVPNSQLVISLIERVGTALATTSANIHGELTPPSFAALDQRIIDAADLVIDAGEAPVGVASTIVDCSGDRPRVVRAGAITEQDIQRVAGFCVQNA